MNINYDELANYQSVKVGNRWYWEKDGHYYEAYICDNAVCMKEVGLEKAR